MQFLLLLLLLVVVSCSSPVNHENAADEKNTSENVVSEAPVNAEQRKPINVLEKYNITEDPSLLISVSKAQKVLGDRALLYDSLFTIRKGVVTYNCSYQALTIDTSGKAGKLFFMYEQYPAKDTAQKEFTRIRTINEKHGLEDLPGVGDEAYFQTDNNNFNFILARKKEKMIRMKVNRISPHTSMDEFKKLAKEIVLEM